MRPFRAVLENPAYWTVHRANVTRAVALGLFIAFVPLPVHVVSVSILALLFQVNVPVAIAAVFVSNPLTMVPQFYCAYWVGTKLLHIPFHNFAFEMSWHWLQTGLLPIWKPFLLGCLTLGVLTATLGYVILGTLWHVTLVMKYHKRKRCSAQSNGAKTEK